MCRAPISSVDQHGRRQAEQHANHACGKQQAVASVAEHKGAAVQKRVLCLRSSRRRRQRGMEPKQRQGRGRPHQRQHLGVRAVVPSGQDQIAVIQVMRLVPVRGVKARDADQLKAENAEQHARENQSEPSLHGALPDRSLFSRSGCWRSVYPGPPGDLRSLPALAGCARSLPLETCSSPALKLSPSLLARRAGSRPRLPTQP